MRRSPMACVLGLMLAAGAGSIGSVQDEPIHLTGEIRPPERILFVKPVYPEEARKDHVEGKVILEIVVGRTGEVENTTVLKSDSVFDQAAIDAVKQWRYSPALKEGEAVSVYLTVIVEFSLKEDPPIHMTDEIKPPERIVFVKPDYPEEAKKEGKEGKVILEVVVNKTGGVDDMKVLKSDPVFDEAALQAVSQWRFSPALKDGKPVNVYLDITVEFKLN